jgi:hypothetical protein
VEQSVLPAQLPDQSFDLIVLSEDERFVLDLLRARKG